ncbi:hypothetical protein Tco_1501163 [Tanacetum coccineum]
MMKCRKVGRPRYGRWPWKLSRQPGRFLSPPAAAAGQKGQPTTKCLRNSLWETSDDEKTDSDDSDVRDAQAGKFGILVHDKETVLDIMKKNLINLFKSSTTSSDTLLISKGKLDLTPIFKKISHDDKDPPENREGETKKRRQQEVPVEEVGGHHANWFKQPNEKKSIEDVHEQSCFNELVDVDKHPEEHELQIGSTFMFAKKMKGFLKKDKIKRADLERPAFELLNNKFKNST